jgi:predicted HAD superfamily Cof-like phosphohydrolase
MKINVENEINNISELKKEIYNFEKRFEKGLVILRDDSKEVKNKYKEFLKIKNKNFKKDLLRARLDLCYAKFIVFLEKSGLIRSIIDKNNSYNFIKSDNKDIDINIKQVSDGGDYRNESHLLDLNSIYPETIKEKIEILQRQIKAIEKREALNYQNLKNEDFQKNKKYVMDQIAILILQIENNNIENKKSDHQLRVEEFMRKAKQEVKDTPSFPDYKVLFLRCRLILEESLELIDGLGCKVDENLKVILDISKKPCLIKIADGIADTMVVTTGTASSFGFISSYPDIGKKSNIPLNSYKINQILRLELSTRLFNVIKECILSFNYEVIFKENKVIVNDDPCLCRIENDQVKRNINNIIYEVMTIASILSIDIDPIIKEVDENNLSKFGPGSYIDEFGKLRKPPNFVGPKIKELLIRQGAELKEE